MIRHPETVDALGSNMWSRTITARMRPDLGRTFIIHARDTSLTVPHLTDISAMDIGLHGGDGVEGTEIVGAEIVCNGVEGVEIAVEDAEIVGAEIVCNGVEGAEIAVEDVEIVGDGVEGADIASDGVKGAEITSVTAARVILQDSCCFHARIRLLLLWYL